MGRGSWRRQQDTDPFCVCLRIMWWPSSSCGARTRRRAARAHVLARAACIYHVLTTASCGGAAGRGGTWDTGPRARAADARRAPARVGREMRWRGGERGRPPSPAAAAGATSVCTRDVPRRIRARRRARGAQVDGCGRSGATGAHCFCLVIAYWTHTFFRHSPALDGTRTDLRARRGSWHGGACPCHTVTRILPCAEGPTPCIGVPGGMYTEQLLEATYLHLSCGGGCGRRFARPTLGVSPIQLHLHAKKTANLPSKK